MITHTPTESERKREEFFGNIVGILALLCLLGFFGGLIGGALYPPIGKFCLGIFLFGTPAFLVLFVVHGNMEAKIESYKREVKTNRGGDAEEETF